MAISSMTLLMQFRGTFSASISTASRRLFRFSTFDVNSQTFSHCGNQGLLFAVVREAIIMEMPEIINTDSSYNPHLHIIIHIFTLIPARNVSHPVA